MSLLGSEYEDNASVLNSLGMLYRVKISARIKRVDLAHCMRLVLQFSLP